MKWNTKILIAEEVEEVGQEAVWTQLTERVVHTVILGATLFEIVSKTWTFHHLTIPHPPQMKAIPNNRDNNNNNSNSNNKYTIEDLNLTTNVIWITISITVKTRPRHYNSNNIHTISSTNSKIMAPPAQ